MKGKLTGLKSNTGGLVFLFILLPVLAESLFLTAPGSELETVVFNISGEEVSSHPKSHPKIQNDEQLREFLKTAKVVKMESIPEGVTDPVKVILHKDGIQIRAIFRDVDIRLKSGPGLEGKVRLNFRDCHRFELAAYELASMLELNNVPVTVKRKIKGKDGALQVWVDNAITEKSRQKDGISPPSPWHYAMQHQVMHIFDNLVYNEDRNQGNILYDEEWKLWMIDHTRAFREDKKLPKPDQIKVCEKNLWDRLQALDNAELRQRLDDVLNDNEINALLARKDLVVEQIRKQIQRKGEQLTLFTFFKRE